MTWLEVSFVLFVASAFRTAVGFGEALIAVPLLVLLIPMQVAAPVAVLASILIAGFVVLRDWRHVDVRGASRLIVSTLFGIPLGLVLLTTGSEALVKGALAGVLFAFSTYSLLQPRRVLFRDDRFAWIFGFVAGVCGGSYGVNGPPLAIYGSLRGWKPETFRATLQGYFFPASLCGLAGYGFAGLWTAQVTTFFVRSLPAIALGMVAGRILGRRANPTQFARVLNVGLLLMAVILAAQCVGAQAA